MAGIVEPIWGTATLLRQGNRIAILILAALLWGAFGLFSPDVRAASDSIALPQSATLSDLKQHALYRPDPESELSAEELLGTMEGFQPYDPAWEEDAPPIWIKLNLSTPANSDSPYRLLVKSRFFLRFDAYLPQSDGTLLKTSSDLTDFDPTEKLREYYVYSLNLDADSSGELLIYVETLQQSLSSVHLSIESETSYQKRRAGNYLAFGLYFGSMLALIFYNFILYLNLRTSGHRLYVIAMVCVLVLMGFNSGLLQELSPRGIQELGPIPQLIFATLSTVAISRFFQVFINSPLYIPKSHRFITILIWTNIAAILPILFVSPEQIPQIALLAQIVIILTMCSLLAASFISGLRGSTWAWVFFAAWAAYTIGTVNFLLLSFNLIPRVSFTENALYIGSVIEALVLALGLSYRVGQLRLQRNRALREQQKAARLANIDSLTGAYNRRFVESYLDGLLSPEDKRAFQGSLIMLDMDSFKAVNDLYGHAAGDLLLQEMARRSLENLRAEDVLARLGGDEFAIVLPDKSGADAIAVAERIREAICEKPVAYGMQPIDMAVSIGIVTEFTSGGTTYSAFKHADAALYNAKRAGRNRVAVFIGAEEPGPQRTIEAI